MCLFVCLFVYISISSPPKKLLKRASGCRCISKLQIDKSLAGSSLSLVRGPRFIDVSKSIKETLVMERGYQQFGQPVIGMCVFVFCVCVFVFVVLFLCFVLFCFKSIKETLVMEEDYSNLDKLLYVCVCLCSFFLVLLLCFSLCFS
jgi:hypothetical protein